MKKKTKRLVGLKWINRLERDPTYFVTALFLCVLVLGSQRRKHLEPFPLLQFKFEVTTWEREASSG